MLPIPVGHKRLPVLVPSSGAMDECPQITFGPLRGIDFRRPKRAQTNGGSKGFRQIRRQRGYQGGTTGPSLAIKTSVCAPRTRSANPAQSYPRTAHAYSSLLRGPVVDGRSLDSNGCRTLGWSGKRQSTSRPSAGSRLGAGIRSRPTAPSAW